MKEDRCGWGPLRPMFCQRFRDPKWLLFCLCSASFFQNMIISGFINISISSIERRFELSSSESGMVASAYDIASALSILPVSYLGGMGCKPRYIGILYFIFGLASMVFSFPHFFTGLYESGSEQIWTCNATTTVDCSSGLSTLSNYKYYFYICMGFMGFGTSALYTLGTAFIEESVSPNWCPIYLGFYYGSSVLGPACGYLLGGLFLSYYVDFDVVDPSGLKLNTGSDRFVGAWWLGFLISGGLAIAISIPLCGFPSELPQAEKYRKERELEVYKGKASGKVTSSQNVLITQLKKLWKSVLVLAKNPTYVAIAIAAAMEGNILVGVSTFSPKFLEVQYQLPSSSAAIYIGLIAVPTAAGGTLVGGYIIKRFQMKMKGILRLQVVFVSISSCFCLCFLISCTSAYFAGVNVDYGATSKVVSFKGAFSTDSCHSSCDCSTDDPYKPICGVDGITYYSPCFAGCADLSYKDGTTYYYNCTCVGTNSTDYHAKEDRCQSGCTSLPIFMSVFAFYIFTTFLSTMPGMTATLRCVPTKERPFAVGVDLFVTKVLGYVPGPIIFGALIDNACQLWQKSCSDEGTCFFYDNKQLSLNLLLVNVVFNIITLIFLIIAMVVYKPALGVEGEEDAEHTRNEDNQNGNIHGLPSSSTDATKIQNGSHVETVDTKF